jgi:acid phosphatase
MPTIGDRLSDRKIDWRYYTGGWALANKPNPSDAEKLLLKNVFRFQWHHQPFAYFARFDPNTEAGRKERDLHLRSEVDLERDIIEGKLPPVAFYKPAGILNEHPGYSVLIPGDEHLAWIVHLMEQSPMKKSFAIFVIYDEFGGQWDHVPPPAAPQAGARADFFGPGPRIPAVVISPLARHGMIDHTAYDTTAILKLIQDRFELEPLPSARVNAQNSLARVFKLD